MGRGGKKVFEKHACKYVERFEVGEAPMKSLAGTPDALLQQQ